MAEEESASSRSRPLEEGAERRRWPREAGSGAEVIGRARLRPMVSHHHPSLRPNGWYRIIRRDPDVIRAQVRQGYIWIDVDGRPRQVWAGHFEVQI